MADDVDNSLLSRLQALRASTARDSSAAGRIAVDVVDGPTTPSREDALAARLKRLRYQHSLSPPSSAASSPAGPDSAPSDDRDAPNRAQRSHERPARDGDDPAEAESLFRTDDETLEEILGRDPDCQLPTPAAAPRAPADADVTALLEELAAAVPGAESGTALEAETTLEDDDSDGEHMTKEAEDVIARFQDELELDENQHHPQPRCDDRDEESPSASTPPLSDIALPSLPSDLPTLPSTNAAAPSPAADDIVARMAALRASSSSPQLSLPSVPTSRPSAASTDASRRLTSRTGYTDDDVDSWCTVCLADAALRCLGCDRDPYCSRCWREMHVGPAAAFDDRSHKAVQFTGTGDEKRKVALGAS